MCKPPIPYEEYLKTLPEKCQHCPSEPICDTNPGSCSLEETKEVKITVIYFVHAFSVNTGKKCFRHEIVKNDKDKAIALANEWQKEFQAYTNDKIEIYVSEQIEVNKEILKLSNNLY